MTFMILRSVKIENYRSIKDETLHCDNLTALVGANGSGKSSFLRAIELFGSEKPGLAIEDYYGRQTENPIRITATFTNLSDAATEQFGDYVLDGELAVTCTLEWNDGRPKPAYYGTRLQNPDFARIRGDETKDAKRKYEDLRQTDAYADLPRCTTKDAVKEAIRQWEKDNPDRCERRRDGEGEFMHARKIQQFVQILYVPPVRDAAEDAQESRNSILSRLMDVAVNDSIAADEKLAEFKERARREYGEIMRGIGQRQLKHLGERMTKTVRSFVPGAKVSLSWGSTELLTESKAEIGLEEDGYTSTVDGAGHGLQRVLIMSMLQHLEEEQAGREEAGSGESPALVILIDEPELYQHPNRQRHMSKVLNSLAGGGTRTVREAQIIYSTHSPHFVRIDRLDRVRMVRKVADKRRGPKVSRVSRTNLPDVARELTKIPDHGTETAQDLAHHLRTIMTPVMNEGFFADVVVLVEGPADREALLAVATSMGSPLESLGISVIPCGGKNNLARPAMIFRKLGIPLYVVWDEDFASQGSTLNHMLMRVVGGRPADPAAGVYGTHACLADKLDYVIKDGFGDKFGEYEQKCKDDLGLLNYDDVIKKPHAVSYLIETAADDDIRFPTIEKIVQNVIKLCPNRAPARNRRARPRAG